MIDSPYEYQIVIVLVEKGKGSKMVLLLLNDYRLVEQREPVGITTIYRTIKRLWSVISKIQKRKEGSKAVNSPWTKAHLRWVTHLLVRLAKYAFPFHGPSAKS
jgi:hypothetical protein